MTSNVDATKSCTGITVRSLANCRAWFSDTTGLAVALFPSPTVTPATFA